MTRSATLFELAGGAQPLIVLPVHVNDKGPFRFVLDTGASTTLVTPELARELAIIPDEHKDARGAGGSISMGIGLVDSLSVGESRGSGIKVGITDEMARIAAAVGTHLDGDLGYDFLKKFSVTIDYSASTVVFEGAAGVSDASLPFELAAEGKGLIVVEAFVNGEGPFDFVLDTGASTTTIATKLADKLGLEKRAVSALTGGGGTASVSLVQLAKLAVGSAEWGPLHAGAVDFLSDISERVGRELLGIVGYNFLRNYRVIIDYPGGRVAFERD